MTMHPDGFYPHIVRLNGYTNSYETQFERLTQHYKNEFVDLAKKGKDFEWVRSFDSKVVKTKPAAAVEDELDPNAVEVFIHKLLCDEKVEAVEYLLKEVEKAKQKAAEWVAEDTLQDDEL